jgi:hypothetical protein
VPVEKIGNDSGAWKFCRSFTHLGSALRPVRNCGWRGVPKLQILAEGWRERRFPTVVEYRF